MFVVVLQVSFFQHFFDHLPYCAGSGPADKIFAIVPQCLRSFSTISQIFSIFFTIMVPSAVMLQFMITSSTPPTRCRGLGLMAVRWLRSRRAWVTASGAALAPGRRRSSPCHGLADRWPCHRVGHRSTLRVGARARLDRDCQWPGSYRLGTRPAPGLQNEPSGTNSESESRSVSGLGPLPVQCRPWAGLGPYNVPGLVRSVGVRPGRRVYNMLCTMLYDT